MLTSQIEKKLKCTIYEKIPDADLDNINFTCYKNGLLDGIYVFSLADTYCYMEVERGKQYRKETQYFDELLWYVLHEILFNRACEYSARHRVKGQDFRRLLHKKEIAEFALFGDDFKHRITKEIVKTLQNYPYNDLTGFETNDIDQISYKGIKYYLIDDIFKLLEMECEKYKSDGNLILFLRKNDIRITIPLDREDSFMDKIIVVIKCYIPLKKYVVAYINNKAVNVLRTKGKTYINEHNLNVFLNEVWRMFNSFI